jgi:hypothetical protein
VLAKIGSKLPDWLTNRTLSQQSDWWDRKIWSWNLQSLKQRITVLVSAHNKLPDQTKPGRQVGFSG